MHEGVTLTSNQLFAIFGKHGLKKMECLGLPFDPNSQTALFEMAHPTQESGSVGVVTKEGYFIHDRVLRAAEVGVVRK